MKYEVTVYFLVLHPSLRQAAPNVLTAFILRPFFEQSVPLEKTSMPLDSCFLDAYILTRLDRSN
ncbi:hypothetical protein [Dendronalium sp. ChiSLP03b]|uniref:hypothetical protein n=1 Tax=Dendronalium sp. ChiSLP03b TaxID=3075381 RepID=UPI002AD35E19|nr:hypothetical protein [Dendronalium sp. ChiSLP03b]MDZ8204504.1 hypothetical protein [Dendronalium sp. ChiSLP03b]